MTKVNALEYIENNITRQEATGRGGGVEIDLAELLPELDNPLLSAYQNYLGGGMLGSIQSNCNFDTESLTEKQQKKVFILADELKKYFHKLTNHTGDEWEEASFEENQARPASAY